MKIGILQVDGADYNEESLYSSAITMDKYQVAETLDTGNYRDITNIDDIYNHGIMVLNGWDKFDDKDLVFGSFADNVDNLKDWKAMTSMAKAEVIDISGENLSGWTALTTSQKDIAVRCIYSYIKKKDEALLQDGQPNPVLLAQYRTEFDLNSILSRKKRHLSVRGYILNGTTMIPEALNCLLELEEFGYINSYFGGLEGTSSGDGIGLFDYMESLNIYSPHPIVSANTTNDEFIVSGDHTSIYINNKEFMVHQSTDNDGQYTVQSSALSGSNTVISVQESVTGSTNDGNIYYNGLLSKPFSLVSMRDGVMDRYRDGKY